MKNVVSIGKPCPQSKVRILSAKNETLSTAFSMVCLFFLFVSVAFSVL